MPPYPCRHRSAKRTVGLLSLSTLMLSALVLAGCSHDESNGVQMPPTVTTIDPVTGKTAQPVTTPTLDGQPNPTTANTLPSPPTEADLGLPFYPGASPAKSLGGDKIVSTSNGIISTLLQTRDPLEKVVAFYKEKMTLPDTSGKRQEPMVKETTQDNVRKVLLSYNAEGQGLRTAEVWADNGETLIQLMQIDISNTPTGISNITGGKPSGSAGGGVSLPTSSQGSISTSVPTSAGSRDIHHTELPTGTRP